MNLYEIEVLDNNNQTISLNNYKDQVLLIVNTATDCEFTEQYDDLEELYEKYHNYVITVSILLNLLQLCYRRIVTFLINIVNCFLGRAIAQIDRRPSLLQFTVNSIPSLSCCLKHQNSGCHCCILMILPVLPLESESYSLQALLPHLTDRSPRFQS